MKYILLIIAVLVLLSEGNTYGQSITWQRVYNPASNADDMLFDICQLSDNNFISVGYTLDSLYIIKFTYSGDTLWGKRLMGSRIYSVVSTNDGGCVFTGSSGFTAKIDGNGNLIWHKFYGGTYRNCYDIKKSLDGGYISCGYDSFYDYILKTDSSGNLQWQRTYQGSSRNFRAIQQYNNGYLVAGGVSDSGCIVKIDSIGNVLEEKRYKLNNNPTYYSSITPINNGYLIGGNIWYSHDSVDAFFVRTDLNCNVTYSSVIPSNRRYDEFKDLKPINQNRYVMTSWVIDSVLSGKLFFKAKVTICDSLGNIIRQRLFFNGEDELFNSVLPLSNGDIIFAGSTWSYSNFADAYLVRSDSLLNSPPIGVKKLSNTIPKVFELFQNYPNPFNNITIIKFNLSIVSNIKLSIYDVQGRFINTLLDEIKQPGDYTFVLNAPNLSSGVYYCIMNVNNIILARKMLLIK